MSPNVSVRERVGGTVAPMSQAGPRGAFMGWLLVGLLSGLCAFACSPTSKRGDDPGAREGGVARDALPGGYEPRIPCGDLGKVCRQDRDCAGDLVCTGSYCVPNTDKTGACSVGGCPKEFPLCLLGTCVSPDQLACICLHPDGRDAFVQCQPVREAPSACIGEDGLCDDAPNACCRGLSCVRGKNAEGEQLLGLCKKRCFDHDNCDTGCCAESPLVASKFCAPHDTCVGRCRTANEECDGDFRPCCEGFVCTRSRSDSELNGCLPVCTKHSDCESKCCALFPDEHGGFMDHGACVPADRCATQN